MLPFYEGKYEPRQKKIDFASAREILMEDDEKMVVKRRFERINNMMECNFYIKNEVISENKEIFIYGFKHNKTDKVDNFILFGCELGVLFGNDKLFNFWSKKLINKEIEKRDFKIVRLAFMTLVKRNSVFENQGICL